MILRVIIDEQVHELNVPDSLLSQAREYFDRLDRDMDNGWRMSRDWVDSPDPVQRCQIVADRLLTALETGNEKIGMLMAGYILSRLPGVRAVELDIQGEIQNTHFEMEDAPRPSTAPSSVGASARGLSKLEAMERAGNEVTQVFRVGRGYRFSVQDPASGGWLDSPLVATEVEASRLRQDAFKTRYEALLAGEGGLV